MGSEAAVSGLRSWQVHLSKICLKGMVKRAGQFLANVDWKHKERGVVKDVELVTIGIRIVLSLCQLNVLNPYWWTSQRHIVPHHLSKSLCLVLQIKTTPVGPFQHRKLGCRVMKCFRQGMTDWIPVHRYLCCGIICEFYQNRSTPPPPISPLQH